MCKETVVMIIVDYIDSCHTMCLELYFRQKQLRVESKGGKHVPQYYGVHELGCRSGIYIHPP